MRVPVPQRDVMVDEERVPLTPEQYDDYQRNAGSGSSQALRAAVGLAIWRMMRHAEKNEWIRDTFTMLEGGPCSVDAVSPGDWPVPRIYLGSLGFVNGGLLLAYQRVSY